MSLEEIRTTPPIPPGKTSRAVLPSLRVLFGETQGVLMSPRLIVDGSLTLGREVEHEELAALRVDTSISRRHAILEVSTSPIRCRITDSGSRNGTFVNGVRVSASDIDDGDVIRVGNSILLWRHEPAEQADAPLSRLAGRSPAICFVRSCVSHVASTPATVLLLGESGAGKSLVALAIHEESGRTGPFMSVNCAAIPDTLAESQLFGHVAGAFTGARNDHAGFFRSAHGGTLFLDEIAELSLPVQAKLLGALEDRAVIPVGGVHPIPCDVRVIAATNSDLAEAVAHRAFRGDLFARVGELIVTLPPLRERREDILPLFVSGFPDGMPRLSPELAEALLLYKWPYNVREVQKVAMQLKINGANQERFELSMISDRLGISSTEQPVSSAKPEPTRDRQPIPTRPQLEQMLREHQGRISEIAALTGRSRKQVYRWLAQYDLLADDFREK